MVNLDTLYLVSQSRDWGGPSVKLSRWLTFGKSLEKSSPSWPQFTDRTVIATFRGRTAIALACKLLGLAPGDEILVPAYNCGSEIDALVASGLVIVPYHVGLNTVIDLADITTLKTERSKAVYIIHYFGWEQPMFELRKWCNEHNLKLIEDCALSLFSEGTSGKLGRIGDAAIYSLPKTLGTLHGGLLSLAYPPSCELLNLRTPGTSILFKELMRSTRGQFLRILGNFGLLPLFYILRYQDVELTNNTEEILPDMPKNYYFDQDLDANRAMHKGMFNIIANLPREKIISARRGNYLYLSDRLSCLKNIRVLFRTLPLGVCPLLLPLITNHRDELKRQLNRAGIESFPWWSGFHHGIIDWKKYPEACNLKQSILTIPIHQDIDRVNELSDMIEHIISSMP